MAAMTPERWQRVEAAFASAAAAPGPEREAQARLACGGDESLFAEVRSLLAVLPHAEPFLETPADATSLARASDGDHDSLVGRRVGQFEVLRRIGAGGMGVVYEARQERPGRMVALKLIRPGMLSRSTLRRFEHEVEVLGRLQHPGIAQIYEAGMAELNWGGWAGIRDGAAAAGDDLVTVPFFAMELIRGRPLLEHAAADGLGPRDRLSLLARIAEAVDHAHHKGVIHRDLKPANILVQDGQPKILDFGVARAIDSDVRATTLRTDAGQIIGTLAYMSPEQFGGSAIDLDTRSDVYALGVIGYELLVDRLPHDIRGRSVAEAARMVMEQEPSSLSTHNSMYRGDIETILRKAMERDRERRYQSAADFAADLQRYLRHEPITARPPSTIYQLGKFARRNKALVGGLAATFLALVLGTIAASIGRAHALEEARKARRMNDYLKGMIAFFEPSEVKGQDVTLRQVLDDAARRVETELSDEPEISAELHSTIAGGYFALEAYDVAEQHLRRGLDLRRRMRGDDDPNSATPWEELGKVLFYQHRLEESEQAIRTALDLNRRHRGASDPSVLFNLRDVIHLMQLQGKHEGIEPLLKHATAAARALPDEATPEIAEATHAVADALATQHRIAEAEPLYRRALELHRRVEASGVIRRDQIVTLRDYALLLEMVHRWDEAEALEREALALCRRRYGDLHEDTLLAMAGLLSKLRGGNRLEEAEALARESTALACQLHGEHSPTAVSHTGNLATILRLRGKPEEAIELFTKTVAARRSIEPLSSLELSKALSGLGASLVDAGRFEQAEAPLRESLALREAAYPPGHMNLATVRSSLGAALAGQGRHAEAEPHLAAAWETLRHAPAATGELRRECLARLVSLYEGWGRPEDAATYQALLEAQPPPIGH
jgi:serine/threonine protein kinase/Flp pilus assembly protein TadD